MKHKIIIYLFVFVATTLFAQADVLPPEKQDTTTVVTDSLAPYRYHVRQMAFFLDGQPVHYTVIFDTVTDSPRAQYRQVDGTVWPFDAIKYYGEKYRKGLLIYESEDTNEKI